MAVSNSPCAACKFLRRKCTQECVFAPYFPPEHPHKFACVHRVFGASNVAKILNDLHPSQREHAVNSLSYEAEMRLQNPVYGCVGLISQLQHQLKQLHSDLYAAKRELSAYIAPSSLLHAPPPHMQMQMMLPSGPAYGMSPYHQYGGAGVPTKEQQELLAARNYELQQQDVKEQHELLTRSYELQQQDVKEQHELLTRSYELQQQDVKEQHDLLTRSYELQQQDVISYNAPSRFGFEESHPNLSGVGQANTMSNDHMPIMTPASAAAFDDNQFQLEQQPQPIQSLAPSQLQQASVPDEGATNAEPSC